MAILDAPFDPTVNRCDPNISHMLNELCRKFNIPENWCEAAKTQAVIQHVWFQRCGRDGKDPWKSRSHEAMKDAYAFWSGR